jgi:hypothetical protein
MIGGLSLMEKQDNPRTTRPGPIQQTIVVPSPKNRASARHRTRIDAPTACLPSAIRVMEDDEPDSI